MDNLWTPGNKRTVNKSRTGGGLDNLLGDLLDDDNTSKRKSATPISTTKKHTPVKKTNSRDDDFYSNLAATAEDGLSDVSEADVDQMAKSIADLEDMDADLFGGSLKKKGSVKGGSERSSKTNTPRRGGTPRSRSTTPRATSPQARVTSPTAKGPSSIMRGTSPVTRGASPTRAETPTSPTGISSSRPGSGKRRTAAAAAASNSMSMSPTPIPEKPGSAPGKMSDIGSASESLKPGMLNKEVQRPGTVPKAKAKYDFGEFNEDDPLAGLLSDDDESLSAAKPVKEKGPVKKQASAEEPPQEPSTDNGMSRRNLFERPPTRSGGNKTPEVEDTLIESPRPRPVVTPAKKKEDPGIFSDDDDFLGGLGIDDDKKPPSAVKKGRANSLLPDDADNSDNEGSQPAKSILDKLLNKESVSKHLETNKEKREFILDKKYTQSEKEEDPDEFLFGSYQPSAASTNGSRPNSRRSVRFQDEDDIFGVGDRPTSRGRSPASKKSEDMEWLNDINTKATFSKQESKSSLSGNKPATPMENEKSNEAKIPEPSKPKVSDNYDWLGIDKDDLEDEEPSWLAASSKSKFQTQKPSPRDTEKEVNNKKPADWLSTQKVKKENDVLGGSDDDEDRDYLGLGKEIDPDTLLKSKGESPVFGGAKTTVKKQAPVQIDDDIFAVRPAQQKTSFASFDRGPAANQVKNTPQKELEKKEHVDSTVMSQPVQIQDMSEKAMVNSAMVTTNVPASDSTGTITTDFFSFNKADNRRASQPTTVKYQQHDLQNQMLPQQEASQQQFFQQQMMLQKMMADLQNQYNTQQIIQPPVTSVPTTPFNLGSVPSSTLTNPPQSLLDAESRIRKLEIERDYTQSLLDSTKKRYEEEITAIENSYKSRLKLMEETQKSKEDRLREDNEQTMSHFLSRLRLAEEEKSNLMSQNYKKMEEFEREKTQETEKLKQGHREALDQLKKEHDDAMMRLRQSKDQQIEMAASTHDTNKSLVATVELIQNNARDLGELQKKVDNWHGMGLDEREISLRSKDEQLRILQERLTKQQEDNEVERQKMLDLTARLETQLREQNKTLDEEKWKLKQEHSRLQSLQMSLEEERRLWTEQQARERLNIEKTRESLLDDEKSLLSQLHKERQSLAEERMQFNVNQKVQRDDMEHYSMKLAHAKAEYEALMKTISDEKNKSFERRQELQNLEERLKEEQHKFQKDLDKQREKEQDLEEVATSLKMKSEEVMDNHMEAQKKFEEGEQALDEARAIEAEEKMRMDSIQEQLHILKIKEKEIAEERLRLSKDKKEVENIRFTLLCPNCRTPRNDQSSMKNYLATVPSTVNTVSNGYPGGMISPHMQPAPNPAIQMSLNSVQTITESIKADRSIRMWKMEALKDQKYLEEQNMFLYTLRHMPYNNSSNNSS